MDSLTISCSFFSITFIEISIEMNINQMSVSMLFSIALSDHLCEK